MMNSVLCVYDLPESLKIKNPSPVFRRWGVRINMSAWIFPAGLVPTEHIGELTSKGATVHMVEFSEQAQEKVLELARSELRQHAKKLVKYVEQRCEKVRARLVMFDSCSPEQVGDSADLEYRKWRTVLSRARRELIAAEQCALGFGITRDVQEATDGLKNLLSVELALALDWKNAEPAAPERIYPLVACG